MKIRTMLLISAALLSMGAAAASAAPVCGAWSASKAEGKKSKTIDGVKHTCDASNSLRAVSLKTARSERSAASALPLPRGRELVKAPAETRGSGGFARR